MFSPIEQFDVIPNLFNLKPCNPFHYMDITVLDNPVCHKASNFIYTPLFIVCDDIGYILSCIYILLSWIFHVILYSTNVSLYFILTMLCVYIPLNFIMLNATIIPSKGQLVVEYLYKFVIGLINDQIGRRGFVYFPFMFLMFVYILQSNLFGLIPFGVSISSYMVFTFMFSLTIWISTIIIGFSMHSGDFLKMFIPEVGWQMVFVLIIIEILSYIIRAFSLALRLSANITAGHTLLHIMAGLNLGVLKNVIWFAPLSLVLLLSIVFLELGVAFVQSYVFLMLSCIYINDVIKGGH